MRVNPDLYAASLSALADTRQNEDTALQQVSSGLRVNVPSDDPAAAAANIGVQDQLSANDVFQSNVTSVTASMQTADSTLNSAVGLVSQAINYGIEGANSTTSQSQQQVLAQQVQDLQSQLMSLANTTYQGTYLFAGTASLTQPFTATPDPSDPTKAPIVTYSSAPGSSDANSVEISSGQEVQTGLPGNQLFANNSNNVFSALKGLADALQNGGDVATALTQVQSAYQYLNGQRTFYGNTLQQVQSTESFLNTDKVQLSTEQNSLISINTDQAVTNLQQAETARQAALSASAQIGQLSLLNYLSGTTA
jgi:flagellar hook-associated protein 3 FlgL